MGNDLSRHRMQIDLDPRVHRAIAAVAKLEGSALSTLIRKLISQKLEDYPAIEQAAMGETEQC